MLILANYFSNKIINQNKLFFYSPFGPHNSRVPTITRAASLTPEHIEVVASMISRLQTKWRLQNHVAPNSPPTGNPGGESPSAHLEAVGTQRHAGRNAAGSAAISDEVTRPDQPAHGRRVILTHCKKILI